jgi:hypothetical protein
MASLKRVEGLSLVWRNFLGELMKGLFELKAVRKLT